MTTPVLYIFAISHFCEKARWALDYLNIEYRLKYLSPITYRKFVRGLGVADTCLPVLTTGSLILQGSSRIIDWAEAHSRPGKSSLEVDNITDLSSAREIEQRLDDVAGVHVRRFYYADALHNQPQKVRPIFCGNLAWQEQIMLRLAWGKVCKYMIRGLDLGVEQGRESRLLIETELDWLDGLLADGRTFVLGKHFSRVDITAASLLSPLVLPPEHPTYHNLQLPPGVAADVAGWQERPSIRWISEIYRKHRNLPDLQPEILS
jgi:glutathione S-transferase